MSPDRAWFLDVGQGHAAVVVSDRWALIIDCPTGKDDSVRQLLGDENAKLEDIFITHRDLDHCGGIPALLENPGATHVHMHLGFALPPERKAKARIKAVLSSIFSIVERDGVRLSHSETAGVSGQLGSVTWQLLSPSAVMVGQAALNDQTNRASMVVLLESSGTRVLVMGDADDFAIQRMIDLDLDINVDALLVPHHGAKLSKLDALLERANPAVVVVSAGRVNGYGHPHASTLSRIAASRSVDLRCTQVSLTCHAGELADTACAGSSCVQFGGDPILVDGHAHRQRVAMLESPVCVNRSS